MEASSETFDFDKHGEMAVGGYRQMRSLYKAYAEALKHILEEALGVEDIAIHSIQARAKEIESFERKAKKPAELNPELPRYVSPLSQITDLSGVRIITFFPKTIEDIDRCICNEFTVIEKTDKAEELAEEGKFGYQSVHYLVKLKPQRTNLSEYVRYKGLIAEIQLRTILQHAWAEMEHDIQYKSISVIPTSIRRRFIALAGVLEIADREFQAIQDEDEELRNTARVSVQEGKLEQVEITPDALKSYLDNKFGPNGRMTPFSYEYTARQLRKLGFTNFSQIEKCIEGYDADVIGRLRWGNRQGQINRFEDTLQAGMGENYMRFHPLKNEPWFITMSTRYLQKLEEAQVPIGNYLPNVEER